MWGTVSRIWDTPCPLQVETEGGDYGIVGCPGPIRGESQPGFALEPGDHNDKIPPSILHAGIDLHSTNSVLAVIDQTSQAPRQAAK